jgi:hypothetical protein
LQDSQHRRSDKGGECGANADVLDAQIKQGEENRDSLLFVPGEHQRQRQIVDAAVEGAGEGNRDFDSGVGIVALAEIKQTRKATDGAEIEFVEAELSAGQGEDQAIFRNAFRELGVVVATGAGSVASADQEEVTNRTRLDGIDDLRGSVENGVVSEPNQDRVVSAVTVETRLRECSGNDVAKIFT